MTSALRICGRDINIRGRLLRVATIEGDKYRFMDDPQPVVEGLQQAGTRVDLFTFMQRLPETTPKYSYPMEWDNFAALPITTFEHWWTEVLGFKGRNKAKQAEKKGVKVREIPFDDVLMQGIWKRIADRADNSIVRLSMLVELVRCAEHFVGLGHRYIDHSEPVATKCH